jgi:hypothetical protein
VGEDYISRNEHNEYLFHHLVAMFQTLALQQLGKLVNPITGKLERDLQQARITIDMLQMLKDRTAGNLEQSERMILDRALLELQMNFVDEKNRAEGPSGPEEQGNVEAAEESGQEVPEGEKPEAGRSVAKEGESRESAADKGAGEEIASPKEGNKKAKAAKSKSRKNKKSD